MFYFNFGKDSEKRICYYLDGSVALDGILYEATNSEFGDRCQMNKYVSYNHQIHWYLYLHTFCATITHRCHQKTVPNENMVKFDVRINTQCSYENALFLRDFLENYIFIQNNLWLNYSDLQMYYRTERFERERNTLKNAKSIHVSIIVKLKMTLRFS